MRKSGKKVAFNTASAAMMADTKTVESRSLRKRALASAQGIDSAVLFLYYAAFALYLGSYILTYTNFELGRLLSLMQWASFFFLFPKLITQHYSAQELIVTILLGLVGLASFLVADEGTILRLFLFAMAGQGANVKTFAKIVFVEEIIVFVLTISCYYLGIIEATEMVRVTDGAITKRSSLGYSHPNRLGSVMLAISCAYAIIRFPRFRWADLLLYVPLFMFVDANANSRGAELSIILVVVFSFVCSKTYGTDKQRAALLSMGLIAAGVALLSIYAMLNFDSSVQWQYDFDDLLSGRLSIAHKFYLAFPITLFGHSVNSVVVIDNWESFVIDNGYAKLFIVYGIIPALIVLPAYIALFVKAYRENVMSVCIFGIFIYACFGFVEWQLLHFAMNYCLVGCCAFLFPRYAMCFYGPGNEYIVCDVTSAKQNRRKGAHGLKGRLRKREGTAGA